MRALHEFRRLRKKRKSLTNRTCTWSVQEFILYDLLGSGSCGEVYLASIIELDVDPSTDTSTEFKHWDATDEGEKKRRVDRLEQSGRILALKIIDTEFNSFRADNEVQVNLKLDHPNIVKFYNHFRVGQKHCLMFEYCIGTLYDPIAKGEIYPDQLAAKYVKDIISALAYCHRSEIIHHDLKPENVFLTNTKCAKLGDFDLSICGTRTEMIVGTYLYFAPEIVAHEYQDYRIDIWALGVLIYELLTGELPFDSGTKWLSLKKIRTVDYIIPENISPTAQDLIRRILVKFPDDRPSLDEILTHPWLD